ATRLRHYALSQGRARARQGRRQSTGKPAAPDCSGIVLLTFTALQTAPTPRTSPARPRPASALKMRKPSSRPLRKRRRPRARPKAAVVPEAVLLERVVALLHGFPA